MGQYYYTVNLSKREFIHPHKLGDGLKAREFAYGPTATVLCALLTKSSEGGGGDWREEFYGGELIVGRWAGDRIVIIGDYAIPTDVIYKGVPIGDLLYSPLCYPEELSGILRDAELEVGRVESLDGEDSENFRRARSYAKRLREAVDRVGPINNISATCHMWYEANN